MTKSKIFGLTLIGIGLSILFIILVLQVVGAPNSDIASLQSEVDDVGFVLLSLLPAAFILLAVIVYRRSH